MKDIQYNAANTRIRTYETSLFSNRDFESWLSLNEAEEIYARLKETSYGDFIDEDSDVHDFEDVLLKEKKRVYEQMYSLAPDYRVVDLFTLKYDYQNLKLLVKADYMEEDFDEWLVPFGSKPLEVLKQLVRVRKSDQVAEQMNACIQEVYEYIEGYQEIQDIDIIFDNHYWAHLRDITEELDHSSFEKMYERNIDIFNISTALRSHLLGRKKGFISAVLIEGGSLPVEKLADLLGHSLEEFVDYLKETAYRPLIEASYDEIVTQGTMETFDLLKDDFMMARLKEQKIVPFGPTALVGYLFAKEMEIKNLRILLISKINKIPEDVLRSKVRESYV